MLIIVSRLLLRKIIMKRLLPIYFFLFFLVSLLFYLFPQLDLWVSSLFYDPEKGFYLQTNRFNLFIYHAIPYVSSFTLAGIIILLLASWRLKRSLLGLNTRSYLFLLLVFVIGPGMVTALFKDNFDRARPNQITEFGGTKTFTPAYVVTDQCDINCSFYSGHPTALYFFVAVAMLFHGLKRKLFLLLAYGGGLLVGMVRVMQGGHFFSDIIISGFMITTVALLLYLAMFYRHKPEHDI